MEKIDLRNCVAGDILISSQGAKLEYVAPTPYKHFIYFDHVVRYIEDKDGKPFGDECYGTRTHDGFVFNRVRIPETDHDIVKIIKKTTHSIDEGPEYDSAGFTEEDRIVNGQYRVIENNHHCDDLDCNCSI